MLTSLRHSLSSCCQAVFVTLFLFFPSFVHASISELELGVMYKTSHVNANNFSQSVSYTGSYAYHFWQSSAIELSYTQGLTKLSVDFPDTGTTYLYQSEYEMIGVDFVLTMAQRRAPLIPYIKIGGARIEKKITQELIGSGQGTKTIEKDPEIIPSTGVGLKIRFSERFSFKLGVDAWPANSISGDNQWEDLNWDYAGRAGITWMI